MQQFFWTIASWQLNFLALPWSLIIIQLLTASELNNSFQANNIDFNPENDFFPHSFIHFFIFCCGSWMKANETEEVDKERERLERNFFFISTIPHTNLYFYYYRCFLKSVSNRDMCEMKGKISYYLFNNRIIKEQRAE